MDLSTAKYIMDYLYFNRTEEPTFRYYKTVSKERKKKERKNIKNSGLHYEIFVKSNYLLYC